MLKQRTLASLIAVLALGTVQAHVTRVSATATSPNSGKGVFGEYCAACHGTDGQGNGPAATALKKRPADLTQLSLKNGGVFPEIRVTKFIKGYDELAAHGTRDMPVWGYVLGSLSSQNPAVVDQRVADLVRYLKSIQRYAP